jgi:hypothetical protein
MQVTRGFVNLVQDLMVPEVVLKVTEHEYVDAEKMYSLTLDDESMSLDGLTLEDIEKQLRAHGVSANSDQ